MPRRHNSGLILSGAGPRRFNFGLAAPTPAPTPTPTPAIPTPTISKSNAAGDPITFDWTNADSSYTNYYIDVQLAGSADFTAAYPGEATIRETIRILTNTDFTDDNGDGVVEMDPIAALSNQLAGFAAMRVRLGHDNDTGDGFVWGDWSNTISENVVVLSASAFDPTAKYAWLTLSNNNLTVTSDLKNIGGDPQSVRANNPRTGKRYFTYTPTTGDIHTVGIGPGSHNYVSFGPPPGYHATRPGVGLRNNGTISYVNSGGTAVQSVGATGSFVAGTPIHVAFDTDASTIQFALGDGAWSAPVTLGLMAAEDWYAYVAQSVTSTSQRVGTIAFSGGARKPAGYEDYT